MADDPHEGAIEMVGQDRWCDDRQMSMSVRAYEIPNDYDVVDRFLVELYVPDDRLGTWLQPRWEYMHSHPYVENVELSTIGIAVHDDGTVAGVVHPEHSPALCYFEVRPGRGGVKAMLVDWAEDRMGGWSRDFERNMVGFYVDDADLELQAILTDRGYETFSDRGEHHARMHLDVLPPEVLLAEGFRLQSLADENDLAKVNRVLWRGFGHDGPPQEDGIVSRARAQQTPNYRKDLNIVVAAPDGSYVAYVGIWYVPENRVSYVEPVATDPDFRRMGLGSAAVLEAVRRTRELGAEVAWVGSEQEFYLDMGFEIVAHSTLWYRNLDAERPGAR